MALLDSVLPPACAGCGDFGAVVCARCRRSFTPPSASAVPFVTEDPGAIVGEVLALAIAAFEYSGPVRRCLARLKYAGARRVADVLGAAAAPSLARLVAIAGPLPIVAVPAHEERMRARGYNQAALLADAVARDAGLRRADPLIRLRPTERQHRLDRGERLRNLIGAFAARRGARAPPALIVVDDILTTSATLEACARALVAAGCAEVYGFAIAREV